MLQELEIASRLASLVQMALLVVYSAVSGKVLAKFGPDEFGSLVETHGDTVRALKMELRGRGFCCRFRLRILNDSTEMNDDEKLVPPLNLKLVQMNFAPPDEVEDRLFFEACKEGRLEEVERRLNKCQNPNAAAERTALHLASQRGHPEVVRLLLEAGASCDLAATDDGTTPLMLAADFGHLEVVRSLLEAGASCNQARTNDGTTSLILAAENGHSNDHLEVVRLLLETRASIDLAATDDGTTPLMSATEYGHLNVVRLLLEARAHCDQARTSNGKTPLHLAAEEGNLEVVRLLLHADACDEARTHHNETPLHVATQHGHDEIARLLQGAAKEKRRKVTST